MSRPINLTNSDLGEIGHDIVRRGVEWLNEAYDERKHADQLRASWLKCNISVSANACPETGTVEEWTLDNARLGLPGMSTLILPFFAVAEHIITAFMLQDYLEGNGKERS